MLSLPPPQKKSLKLGRYGAIQSAVLYTNSFGERRIRVQTLSIPVVTTVPDLFRNADCGAITNLIAKMGKSPLLIFSYDSFSSLERCKAAPACTVTTSQMNSECLCHGLFFFFGPSFLVYGYSPPLSTPFMSLLFLCYFIVNILLQLLTKFRQLNYRMPVKP